MELEILLHKTIDDRIKIDIHKLLDNYHSIKLECEEDEKREKQRIYQNTNFKTMKYSELERTCELTIDIRRKKQKIIDIYDALINYCQEERSREKGDIRQFDDIIDECRNEMNLIDKKTNEFSDGEYSPRENNKDIRKPIISNFDFLQVILTFVPPSSTSIVTKSLPNFETISFNFFAGRVILPTCSTCASTVVITVKTKSVAVNLTVLFSSASIKILYKTGDVCFNF